jgi:hypothetical protein
MSKKDLASRYATDFPSGYSEFWDYKFITKDVPKYLKSKKIIPPDFQSKQKAFDALERVANDGCIDNHRFAFLDEPEAVEEFKKKRKHGVLRFS